MSTAQPRSILAVIRGESAARVLGLTIPDRHRRILADLGVPEARVLHMGRTSDDTDLPFERMADSVLVLDGSTLLDPRLVACVMASGHDADLIDASDGSSVAIGASRVGRAHLRARLRGEPTDSTAVEIDIDRLPRYVPSLRRHLPPYWCRLVTGADRRRAEDLVLDSVQKGVLDFPARYLHPAPENALTRRLAGTAVTPTHVTLVCALVAFMATYLFATASYGVGAIWALVANVLDGVDGKLARVTHRTSRFGDRLDHTLDVAFEFSWYVALGWSLDPVIGPPRGLVLAACLVFVMLACRALSGTYRRLADDRSIHDDTRFDRGFRLVAARRNIFVLLILAGALTDTTPAAFCLGVGWAVITCLVYAARNVMAVMVSATSGVRR